MQQKITCSNEICTKYNQPIQPVKMLGGPVRINGREKPETFHMCPHCKQIVDVNEKVQS